VLPDAVSVEGLDTGEVLATGTTEIEVVNGQVGLSFQVGVLRDAQVVSSVCEEEIARKPGY
jgi:hypothetical protein